MGQRDEGRQRRSLRRRALVALALGVLALGALLTVAPSVPPAMAACGLEPPDVCPPEVSTTILGTMPLTTTIGPTTTTTTIGTTTTTIGTTTTTIGTTTTTTTTVPTTTTTTTFPGCGDEVCETTTTTTEPTTTSTTFPGCVEGICESTTTSRPLETTSTRPAETTTTRPPVEPPLCDEGCETTTTLAPAPAGAAPRAADDGYRTIQDLATGAGRPGVLGNDAGAGADPLVAQLVTGPAHGRVKLNADGSFIYDPAPGFVGTDTFRYRAFDGDRPSNVALVTIVVAPRPAATTTTTTTVPSAPPVVPTTTTTTIPPAPPLPPTPPAGPPPVATTVPAPAPVPSGGVTTVVTTTAPPTTAAPTTVAPNTTPTAPPTSAAAPPPTLVVKLSTKTVVPTGQTSLDGSGCDPSGTAAVTIDGAPAIEAHVGDDGTFTSPLDAPPAIGRHELEVRCGKRSQTLDLDVVSTTADVGTQGSAALVLALFLLVVTVLTQGRARRMVKPRRPDPQG